MTGNAFKTVVTIGILVALVGGITFVSQYVAIRTEEKRGEFRDKLATAELVLPKHGEETLFSEMSPVTGFCDYLFTNPADFPVEVGLEQKSCKCAGVDVRTLTPAEKETYLKLSQRGALAQAFSAPPQLLAAIATGAALREQLRRILDASGEWVELMDKKGSVMVPAEGSGLVRVRWEGKQTGPQRLKAVLWSQPVSKQAARGFATIELPMVYVPPITISPPEAPINELTSGSRQTIGFTCFSATRSDFTLSAREEHDDPCFEVTCEPRSLEKLAKDLADFEEKKFPIMRGYTIWVTVHENRNGKQLDFGPFRRRIFVYCDAVPEPAAVVVTGSVASDLRVVGDKQSRINLGVFDADSAFTKSWLLESDRPGLQLALESHAPAILKVNLGEPQPTLAGGRQWKLEITVPRNSVNGWMPPASEIVLKTQDAASRRFRIPLSGNAVVR